MKELNDFFEYKQKLLYASEDFVGYDPLISVPLTIPEFPKGGGEAKAETTFTLGGEEFKASMSVGIFYGPIRGFKDIKIYRGETLILQSKSGSQGHGSNFFSGNTFLLEGRKGFLIVRGYGMRYRKDEETFMGVDPSKHYLLVFDGVSKPSIFPEKENISIPAKDIYTKEEIEAYRQTEWKGHLLIGNQNLEIEYSKVPKFSIYSWEGETTLFKQCSWMHSLSRTVFSIEGEVFQFGSKI